MELLLDSQIRNWVLIPIIVVMFLSAMLRNNIAQLLTPAPSLEKTESKVSQIIARTTRLRTYHNYLPEKKFKQRRNYFCKSDTGILNQQYEAEGIPAFMDPTQALGGMKRSIPYAISTVLLLSWVSHFCSGFIIAKIPFNLTQRFRGLVQRGVELDALDVRYVSSSSLYFLALMGINGIVSLFTGDKKMSAQDKLAAMGMPMGMGMPGMMGAPGKDFNKMIAAEKDNLKLMKYRDNLENVEDYLLKSLDKD